MRIHMQRLYTNTGNLPELLQGPECPPECLPLWDVFCTLGRAASDGPLAPLTQTELAAWQANHGVKLSSWEIDTLFALDNVAAQVRAQHKHEQGLTQ